MNNFGFTRDQLAPVVDSRQTHSYINEDDVVGRKEDQTKIVHMLLYCESQKLSIIPIVGIGGMGKTTLAQLVFNDATVRAQFQIYAWVCVSEPFIIGDVIKKIIDSAIEKDCGLKTDNMELLQRRLRKELGEKKYFLVLDDVWNQDQEKWDALRILLCCGGMGSVVLVTTREEKVASIMGAPDVYYLQHLNPEDSWTLFKRRAFSFGVLKSSDHVEIGKEIVKKCCGVPLAVKSMGSLMSRKHEVKEWLAILESPTWDEENQIMPALKLSYHHLPSHMKQCFVFCAVFPKDYDMNKKDLIHLWIANGFISPEGTFNLETVGNKIFSELVWRSFFQDVKQERSEEDWGFYQRYYEVTTCKIHDLLHDLAQTIGNGEYFSMQKGNEINKLPPNVLHLHYSSEIYFPPPKIHLVVQHHPDIRSIFCTEEFGDSAKDLYFPNSSFRVFGTCSCRTERIFIEPAFVKHLRYLDLTRSSIITLPNSISALYNLQILVLNGCEQLKLLPEDMRFMINLRHLYLDECNRLEGMPGDLGQLSCLQTLTKYIVGKDRSRGIKELGTLELGGKLEISGLMNVTSQSTAKEANLESKQNLEELTLSWDGYTESPPEDSCVYPYEEVLDALKPHDYLQVLNLVGYMGPRFSMWVTDSLILQRLVKLTLSSCVHCINIPHVWQLPCLEILRLIRMCNLKYLCNSRCMDEQECRKHGPMFPKLKKLSLERLELLERWKENDDLDVSSVIFPVLDNMTIINCPKLMTLPKVPVLKDFILIGNNIQIDLAASLTTLSSLSLTCLTIPEMPNDPSESKQNNDDENNMLVEDALPWGSLANLSPESDQVIHIKHLTLEQCDTLQSSLSFWKLFVNLEWLSIFTCRTLTFWPEKEFQSLSSLKHLGIYTCKNFTGLPPTLLSVNPSADGGPHRLEELEIHLCPNLVVFPASFACLKSLAISASSKLESIPEGLAHHGTLQSLRISHCPSLTSLHTSIHCLSNLTALRLEDCNSLTTLSDGMHNLTALKTLCISNCPQIKALPEGLQQRLCSLEKLSIEGCPALARRCKHGGDYWDKVKDIPGLEVIGDSIWRNAARAIIPACTNKWYKRPSSDPEFFFLKEELY